MIFITIRGAFFVLFINFISVLLVRFHNKYDIIVSAAVCNTITFDSLDVKVHFCSAGTAWKNTGQVCM